MVSDVLAPSLEDTPHQGESLALLCGVTDRRTGSEDFSEKIRTFKVKWKEEVSEGGLH